MTTVWSGVAKRPAHGSARRGRKGRFSTFAPARAPHSAISPPKTELLRPCGREVMGGLPPRCAPFGRLRGVMHGCALRALAASAASAPILLLPSTYSAQYLTIMCMTGGIPSPAILLNYAIFPLRGVIRRPRKRPAHGVRDNRSPMQAPEGHAALGKSPPKYSRPQGRNKKRCRDLPSWEQSFKQKQWRLKWKTN